MSQNLFCLKSLFLSTIEEQFINFVQDFYWENLYIVKTYSAKSAENATFELKNKSNDATIAIAKLPIGATRQDAFNCFNKFLKNKFYPTLYNEKTQPPQPAL